MDKKIITHVFAALQNLERCHERTSGMLDQAGEDKESLEVILPQHAEVLKQMRRTANYLQFEVAREDWLAVVRSLKIFYGLNHLIRGDLLAAHSKLIGEANRHIVRKREVNDNRSYH